MLNMSWQQPQLTVMLFDVDKNSEDGDCSMTAADLATESDVNVQQRCSLSSNVASAADGAQCGNDVSRSSMDRIASKQSTSGETNGCISAESCESRHGSMTDSTKSYSWSSSLPNGSRLETLSLNTVAQPQPASGLALPAAEKHSDAVRSPENRSRRSVGGVATTVNVTQQNVVDSRRSKKPLRVGDVLPSRDEASERPFSSPRLSHIEHHSNRRRAMDMFSFNESQHDGTITFPTPAASVSSHITSTPSMSASSNSALHNPPVNQPPVSRVGSHSSVSDRYYSEADIGSLWHTTSSRLDRATSSSCYLSTGQVEDTVLPISYQNITNFSTTSTRIGQVVSAGDAVGFVGRILGSAQSNSSARRVSRKLHSGMSFCSSHYILSFVGKT